MITQVVFIGDISRGDQYQNIVRLERIFSPILKQLDVASFVHVTDINRNGNCSEWVESWQKSFSACRVSEIATLDLEGAAIIGFEVSDLTLKYLDQHGVPWINFAIHPLRFLDDLYFDVTTSFTYDLRKHSATVGLIDLCVQSLRTRYPAKGGENGQKTLAIFGQTPIDKSVYFDGQFRCLDSYVLQLDELVKQYERILFKPHPYMTVPDVDGMLKERYDAKLCTGVDIYELFLTAGVSGACAISSSVLTEAPHFGIQAIFLEPRAKRYGFPISYRSLLDDHHFWAIAFLGRRSSNEQGRISHAVPVNFLRSVFATWGYVTDETLMERRLAEKLAHASDPLLHQFELLVQKVDEQVLGEIRRAERSEVRATELEQRAVTAETRAAEQEQRAVTAETRAAEQEQRAVTAETRAAEQEQRAVTAEAHATSIAVALEKAHGELGDVLTSSHNHRQVAEARHQQVQALLNSKSWQLTAPLRWVAAPLLSKTSSGVAWPARTYIDPLIRKGMARPQLVAFIHAIVRFSPSLRSALTRRVEQAMSPQSGLARQPNGAQNNTANETTIAVAHLPNVDQRVNRSLRANGISIIRWAGDRAQSSHGFRRFALKLLRVHPRIEQTLRRVYQESRGNNQPQSFNWVGPPNMLKVGPYAGKKVALLAPSAANGALGGAERFYNGLLRALRDQGCNVDFICPTVDESSFEAIQQGYRTFSNLDLSTYDLVISTKAPTYVVKHPNHVLYLVHTVRVFYDMFDEVFPFAGPELLAQRSWIHQADSEAISRITKRFSIGAEVSRRLVQWNNNDAEVLHPPTDVVGLYDAGIGDYFFMPGRLHPWKRVDLAIKAIKCSVLPLRLLIAGEGEGEKALRQLAEDDPRIQFLGRVDDDRLKTLYAEALAVPFLPLREDYGYITLEAFASGKPVVTCTDSGEPTAFVAHRVTGLVCAPEPQAICDAFEQLWNDRAWAKKLGQAGHERIADIRWPTVVERLLAAGFLSGAILPHQHTRRLRIAILDMQPIMPAVGGGRLRLLGLYHALGDNIEARYVGTYDWPGEKYRRHFVSPNLEEIDVPLSAEHHAAAAEAAQQAGGRVVIDMVFGRQGHLSPDYLTETIDAAKWADVVVISHPWVAPLVDDELLAGKVVIYDSHNVESVLRGEILDRKNPFEHDILGYVEETERRIGDRADVVLACSDEDARIFSDLYKWPQRKIVVVPNGVFSQAIQPPTDEQKCTAREKLGVRTERTVAFFIGSDYAPNVEAAKIITEELAPVLPQVEFVIAGGVCGRVPSSGSKNVRFVGFVDDSQRLGWLHASDFAINPMCSGSGTNIKMFDFMAAALPIVTTAIGARGISVASTNGIRIAERGQLADEIKKLITIPEVLCKAGSENRAVVERRFSWEKISPGLGLRLRSVYFRKTGTALLSCKNWGKTHRIAHLSTVGITCGIAEYTKNIIHIYRAHGIDNLILSCEAAAESPVLTDHGAESYVAWYLDNESWLTSHIRPDTIERLVAWRATRIIIQYHPGFYSANTLLSFVKACIENAIAVTVVVHNFTKPCVAAFWELNALGVLIFSHRETEVQEAKLLGVSLELIPLGVDVLEPLNLREITGRNWLEHPPIIVTNGFLRKHKGVRSLIKAMPRILRIFPGARLQIQCSLYPSDDSRDELEACQKEIARNDLAKNVILNTHFCERQEVLAELARADLAVLPYHESSEGGSASATDVFAVGLPLVVSTAEIFDGIRDVVATTKPDPESLAHEILSVLSTPEKYHALAVGSLTYARENSWHNVAGAFLVAL